MSCSKPLPPFTFDVLCCLNRDQLERFSIVCHPLKNFIDRYFNSKPYRIFDQLFIRGGSYALRHNLVHWLPNREDYSVQQFLDGQRCSIDHPWNSFEYDSFKNLRPYLGPTIRIKSIFIHVGAGSTYNAEHIAEMESIAYLWRDGKIEFCNARNDDIITVAKDFQLILNSPTILQCRYLIMDNTLFSFKDYKVLYSVKVIEVYYHDNSDDIDPNYWLEFVEQPGLKPIVFLVELDRSSISSLLERFSKVFLSAVLSNAFKIVFALNYCGLGNREPLTQFRETNKTSSEILELKKGLPVEYQEEYLQDYENKYTLERSTI